MPMTLRRQLTIGLIGGMSWESTASYYRAINQEVKTMLGGLHSAKIAMVSVDFAEIELLQHSEDWDQTADILSAAARALEAAGADFFLICTNTMHKVAKQVEAAVSIPLLHIADATGEQLIQDGITKVGLLGTRFTMEQGFYENRLVENFGIDVITPTSLERQLVHQVIYDELCLGHILDNSKNQYVEIINRLSKQGAQGIILGCTEIALLVKPMHTQAALYDTASIHAKAAVKMALT
jgi:aspartate racemase